MSLDFLKQPSRSAALVGGDLPPFVVNALCLALLGTACALASLVFACAAPFAAFATVAAAMLPLRSALFTTGAAWLINQAIGFGILNYPIDANTIAWGGVILAAALGGAVAACFVLHNTRGNSVVAPAMAFVAAFTAYELLLLAATPLLGGHEALAPVVVARIAGLNLVWFLALVVTAQIMRMGIRLRIRPDALVRR